MGDTRRRKLPVILAILAALVVGFAAPASASFTTLAPAPPTASPAAASSLAASVDTPTPSLGTGLSWSRTPTGPRSYFGARYYASKIGRFTTVDPVYTWNENLLDPQRWNRYSYVRNNPFKYVDPDGRVIESPWDILNIGIGVVSFGANVAEGNVGAAAIDAAGVVVDVLAAAVPGVPGGAGTAIKAARAAGKIDSAIDAAKGVDFTADLGRTAAKSRSGHRYAGNKQLHEAMAADAAHRGQMEAKYGADAFDRTSTRGGGRRNPQGAEWDHNSTEPTALDLRSKESHLEKTKREGQAGGGWKRFHREQKE